MFRTKTVLFILCALFVFGYGLGVADNAWYEERGNIYFHFLGGFFIAAIIASYYANEFKKLSQPLRSFCVVGLTIGVAVLWEFHEFVLGNLVNQLFIGNLADTIKDIFMGVLGGIASALIWPLSGKK